MNVECDEDDSMMNDVTLSSLAVNMIYFVWVPKAAEREIVRKYFNLTNMFKHVFLIFSKSW